MSLTKKELEDLYHLTGEINDLDRQISELSEKLFRKQNIVADAVKDYRFIAKGKVVTISGFNRKKFPRLKALRANLSSKQDRSFHQRLRIEHAIDAIEDIQIRRIIRLRYIDHFGWSKVAREMGPYATADAVRKSLDRYFDEKK